MELNICEGDYGLPSLDSDCLHLLLLANVTKIPLNVISRQIKYPIFAHDTKIMREYAEVQNHLVKLGFSVDYSLTSKQKNETYVLKNMLKLYISPIIKYLWWVNECNYENFTSKWFMSSAKFPFNFTGLRRLKSEAASFFELNFANETLENIKMVLNKGFKECLYIFAARLLKSPYIYGDDISSLDIVLYGYLAPILKIPFPENEFKEILESNPIFSSFVSKINKIYFPEIQYTEKYIKTSIFDDYTDHNHQNIVFFFGFIVSMTILGVGVSKVIGKENIKT